jgi:DNA helicase II / ATP-dependent DNA helicase PcrA
VWRPPVVAAPQARAAIGPDAPTAPPSLTLRGGERVRHPKFGSGTVVGVRGEGAKAEVTVVFEQAGAKRLLLRLANLSRA